MVASWTTLIREQKKVKWLKNGLRNEADFKTSGSVKY